MRWKVDRVMPQEVCSKLLQEPSIVLYFTMPVPKCSMHGGLDRQAGKVIVWRIEWIVSPNPVSSGVRLNLYCKQGDLRKILRNQLEFVAHLFWSRRVASMTRRASRANCWAPMDGWTIFRWLNEGVLGWIRISFSRRTSSKWMMSFIRSDAWLTSLSNCSFVMKRISNPVRFPSSATSLQH